VNSRIYFGTVAHQRLEPLGHAFTYPVYFFGIDLAELTSLHQQAALFSHNHFGPFAIHDRDYLEPSEATIASKFRRWIQRDDIQRVHLITTARYFGYAFNPVNFYLAFTAADRLVAAAAEVNNTFGDRHLYLLDEVEQDDDGFRIRNRQPKAFHVSPFMDMEGEYRFEIAAGHGQVELHVDLWRDGRPVLQARLNGAGRPLTSRDLLHTLVRFPFNALLTMPRILKHAAILYYKKNLPVFARPEPEDPMTLLTRPPKRTECLAGRIVLNLFSSIHAGCLRMSLPGGEERQFGNPLTGRNVHLHVRRHRFFTRLLRSGEVGVGEAYTAGDFECTDLPGLVALLIENREALANGNLALTGLSRFVDRMGHWLRPNSRRGSRKNIHAHYDLSNAFFQTFLDPTMTYSCARFRDPDDTLEEAQRNKLQDLLDQARIEPHHHLLEIGSGWGSFAMLAAQQTGCRVTSLTLSEEQQRLATERVAAAGLSDRIDIVLCDYRDVKGSFDRIVSIEMLEAVGHAYLGTFFRRCDEVLQPGGRAVFQVITMPDHRYDAYRRGYDWIRKHIFPGGHLPSLTALSQAMARNTRFHVEALTNIGPDYARTLRLWREACEQNRSRILDLGWDDAGYRKWTYYLAYCEAAFATRSLNTLQLVLTRATEGAERCASGQRADSDRESGQASKTSPRLSTGYDAYSISPAR
jgi:cyclopropane-fatty-acyl-phospholipid synthase